MSTSQNTLGNPPAGGRAENVNKKAPLAVYAQWALAVLIPLAVYAGCSAGGLPVKQTLFFTLTSSALVLWALGLMSDTFVAIALPIFYIVLQVGKPNQILNSWMSSVGWIVVGGLVFANMMMRTGLAKRLAIWALYITRGSFNRLLWGILLAGFVICPAIPSIMGKAALISVVCIGICEALSLERQSKAASAVVLAGFIGIATSKIGLLTGAADITMYVGQMAQVMGKPVSWGEYFLHNFPLSCIYGVLSLLTLILVLRPKMDQDSTAYVTKAHAELGPMDTGEKKTGTLILLLILLLLTDRFHGLDAGWIIIMLSFVAFIPAVGLMNESIFQKMSLASVFFVVGCMSIGSAAKASGADKMLVDAIAPLFKGQSGLTSMLLGYLAGSAMNLLLTPLAAFSAMTVPLTELALEVGVSPIPVMYAFSYGLEQYIFPYEYAVLLFFYATGWVNLRHIMLVFFVRFIVAFVLLAAVAYPYWSMLGVFDPIVK
ncbi:conserved membrane hypothetical protein [uncultured delta proteobacterium]|uniref:Sodium/sulphate symporter n=1 Tax=uncultured delta proteobacterium TaxID=34034 RepID=A0A212K632_9DELT|nr:conserved membrane hypothetical protein [uncultured delta proteobacterium]